LKAAQAGVKAKFGVFLDFVADHANGILTPTTSLAAATTNMIEDERSFVGATHSAILVKPSAPRIGASPTKYFAGFSFQIGIGHLCHNRG
jgi:hypothetical protein